jgi:hypothetical protein
MGELRHGQKSDLVKCLQKLVEQNVDTPSVDAKIIDGAVVVQMLSPGLASTFQDYADEVFLPFVLRELRTAKRVDVIWDVYLPDSLKAATRETRGSGTRRRVLPVSNMPKNWKGFLRVNDNKTELFHFLANQLHYVHVEEKEIYTTYDECVLSSPNRQRMSKCSHEEADTRIMLHAQDASRCGHKKIIIRTNDTDVVALAISNVNNINANELWIAFGTGKNFRYLAAHNISAILGENKAKALTMFHAITGCDTTSFFSGKGKKTSWDVWDVFPQITDVFVDLSRGPDSIDDCQLEVIERTAEQVPSSPLTKLDKSCSRRKTEV